MEPLAVFPKVESLYFNSGNVVNWNSLKSRPTQTSGDELVECFRHVYANWYSSVGDKKDLQYAEHLRLGDTSTRNGSAEPNPERANLKLTMKLFAYEMNPDLVQLAVGTLLNELKVGYIDTVLLSVPPPDKFVIDEYMPLWKVLENYVHSKQVRRIGPTDLQRCPLEKLYEAADVKPSVNQINLSDCCFMPPELSEYAKEKEIQLLTHNDDNPIISSERFQEVMGQLATARDGCGLHIGWAARYTAIIQCRGIINTKGYMLQAFRDPNLVYSA